MQAGFGLVLTYSSSNVKGFQDAVNEGLYLLAKLLSKLVA